MSPKRNVEIKENFSDEVVNGYHSFCYRDQNNQKLRYRFFRPLTGKENEKYPLVVYLHGAGSWGKDNIHQLEVAQKITSPENVKKHPCFVFAPQSPTEKKWVNTKWTFRSHTMSVKPSVQMRLVLGAIEEIIRINPVDLTRIYVCGQSMGGFGCWDIICRRPDLFAAAVPICGGADENQAAKIVSIPVWAFHGACDPCVHVERSRNMIIALKKAGGTPKYTEYPEVFHNAWDYAYSPELFDWMFSQKKSNRQSKSLQKR